MTYKVKCSCKHEYQDKLYGKQVRVANQKISNVGIEVKCTVCSLIHKVG